MFDLYSSEEFEKNFTYQGKDLGAICHGNNTSFRVWAPTAEAVFLRLYKNGTPVENEEFTEIPMFFDICGTWTYMVCKNLHGFYYTFKAVFHDNSVECCDPYAKAVGVNGIRSMVVDFSITNPKNWDKDYYNGSVHNITEAIIYEVHIRDLTADNSSGVKSKGKYNGLCEENTHTKNGSKTGLSHIKELGVTHVQLLPFFDFGSVDESKSSKCKYNWGYDPVNYNAPEGSYSSNPYDGTVRITELKKAVQTLHRCGLGIVMDVVYNHVYHAEGFSFNKLVPMYFSRLKSDGKLSNATGCGNDTASERSMVRKFIVDSVNHWADEYHIDGFRFDLAGILDVQTISECIASVHKTHPHVLFYGEGWDMPTVPTKSNFILANQHHAKYLKEFSFFNDTVRDVLRGSVFNVNETGFISGADWCKPILSQCFRGNPGWAFIPAQCINYVSCHDNHTLYDRVRISLPENSEDDVLKRNLLAASFVFLSQGVPFFQAGEELLKSKKTMSGQYIHNSYRSPDKINSIKWDLKDAESGKKVFEYYKGLIKIRKTFSFFHYKSYEEVNNHIRDIEIGNNHVVGFHITDYPMECIIIFNADKVYVNINLPEGVWYSIVENTTTGVSRINSYKSNALISPATTLMLIKESR